MKKPSDDEPKIVDPEAPFGFKTIEEAIESDGKGGWSFFIPKGTYKFDITLKNINED